MYRRGPPSLKEIFPVPQNVDESRFSCFFPFPRLQLSQMRSLSVFFHVLTLGNAARKPNTPIFGRRTCFPAPERDIFAFLKLNQSKIPLVV